MTIETFTKLDGTLQKVRVVEIEGKPWFGLRDVCKCLGISHHRSAQGLSEGEMVVSDTTFGRGSAPRVISEGGLYRLIMRSDKKAAKPFQTWVTQTVLPTLRREGVYVRDEEKVADASSVEDLDSLNDMIVGLMKRKTELLEVRLAEKEAIIFRRNNGS
ncbi:BRO-N domain-containing protein [Komagataeibacter oboediens]|uniref:BRO-N domain-containing protein n=1 Tax=Komagataeibacter oboediens TaxID=65958 RepID=UPI001A5F7C5A|nr:BRO family protein [Komagataeibacter oboediens]MBL7232266.1 hypothetical protein [Komagataeibacter oboediens]